MKKTRGSRKKISHSKHRRRLFSDKALTAFNSKMIVVLVVLVFLASALVLSSFHNSTAPASTGYAITGNAETNFIADLFTKWQGGQLDVNIAKYLFWLMLTGVIWAALSFAKFPENGALQALIAIPVGFLATAYITPAEVFTVLTSYTALGITLTFLIPFIIMIFVSAMLAGNEKISKMSVPKVLIEMLLWIFFLVIQVYKMIEGWATGQIVFGLSLPVIIMVLTFFVTILIVIFPSKFRKMMWNIQNDIRRAQNEVAATEAVSATKLAKQMEEARKGRGYFD
ncbi:Uncharacterised protein [uncultured archaeon]|nr:Uncharacterised protein [uncultured archaeon]